MFISEFTDLEILCIGQKYLLHVEFSALGSEIFKLSCLVLGGTTWSTENKWFKVNFFT